MDFLLEFALELPLISVFLFALDAVFVFVTIRKARKILRTFPRK